MVEESNQNVFLIQIDASSFAEFEISEFEISRVDCILFLFLGFSAKCLGALGMADGTITDDQLSASSYFHWTTKPEYGRPGDWGWLPLVNLRQREYDYFQVFMNTLP